MEDSGAIAVEWANLPADLVATVGGELENCREVVGLRSVCRWWRFSTLPPRNKISGLFPLRPSFLEEIPLGPQYDRVLSATAVYLVQRGKEAPWMVSVQEESAGKLVLRHPLYFVEIPTENHKEEMETHWATQTPVARSYTHNHRCGHCNRLKLTHKVAFILQKSPPGSASAQLVGLCKNINSQLWAFRTELGERTSAGAIASQSQWQGESSFHDFVTFNQRIFALERVEGQIYVLDDTSLHLIQIGASPSFPDHCHMIRFVVSDGDLYLVLIYKSEYGLLRCLIYRLQVKDCSNSLQIIWEQVEELGEDKVFFIGLTNSFSVSARLLPPPWKGNCVVYGEMVISMCGCDFFCMCYNDPDPKVFFRNDPVVFFLGRQCQADATRFSSLPQGYSHLFSPPVAAADAADAEL